MTETSPQPAVPPRKPRLSPDAIKATDTAVALRAISDVIGICELYYEFLVQHVTNTPSRGLTKKQRKSHYDRLASVEAFLALALVWKESPCVTRKHLACAGFIRSFADGITRNALGNALQNSDRRPSTYLTANMFSRRAQRIIASAIAYGLVEEKILRDNCKPLRATKALHAMMAEIGSEAAVILLAPNGHFACGLARPRDDDGGEGTA